MRKSSHYHSSSCNEQLVHYYSDDQKAYDKLHKNLLQEQLECAQLLLDAGISPLDESSPETDSMTALFCAVKTKSLPLA